MEIDLLCTVYFRRVGQGHVKVTQEEQLTKQLEVGLGTNEKYNLS